MLLFAKFNLERSEPILSLIFSNYNFIIISKLNIKKYIFKETNKQKRVEINEKEAFAQTESGCKKWLLFHKTGTVVKSQLKRMTKLYVQLFDSNDNHDGKEMKMEREETALNSKRPAR